MAAKGGVWTKKGFVKAANRKDTGGGAVAVADTDLATKLNSSVITDKKGKQDISNESHELYEEAKRRSVQAYRNEADASIKEALVSNETILSGVRDHLEERKGNSSAIGVTVKDKNGKTQAVAAVELTRDSVYVEYLATHPDNVFKDNPKAVRGAGTQAMARIAKLAQERKLPVKLFTLNYAQPFYEKLGFEPDKPGSKRYTLKGEALDKLAARAR